jgi:hypothetical protein
MDADDGAARRRRAWIIGGVAAVVVVIAGVAIATRGGGDDQVATDIQPAATNPPTTSTAVTEPTATQVPDSTTTTEPTTFVAVTSVPATEPLVTTTAAAPSALDPMAWFAQCTERNGDAGATYSPNAANAVFGPLGARPALQIMVPLIVTDGYDAAPTMRIAPIPGGVLAMARSTAPDWAWVLAAVDEQGSIRWRRCVSGSYPGELSIAPSALGPTTVFIQTFVGNTRSWRAFDLVTGSDVDAPAELDDTRPIAESERYLLLGPSDDSRRISVADDALRVLDKRTGSVTTIPYPERADGQESFNLVFDIDKAGDKPVLFHLDPFDVPAGVYLDGQWRTDEASIRATAADRVREDFDGHTLSAIDPLGDTVWSIPDFDSVPGEGFRWAETDGVVIVNRCLQPSDVTMCDGGSMIGLDMATGEQLWQLAGFRGVSAFGDGAALITDENGDGFVLIDVSTGERVDAPEDNSTWADPDAFRTACCGEGDYVWVGRDGGTVVAVDNGTVSLWYPPSSDASQSLSVSLMD